MTKERVDILLVKKGLAESRSQAQRLIMAGKVRANDQVVVKPSSTFQEDARLELETPERFVSRGGEKLEFAIQQFDLVISGKVCADVGASTGGFTDCLLQHGASKVYAIDVGKGVLHWNLRQDSRVVVLEKTNARYLEGLPEPIDLVTIDASFISLKLILPVVKNWLLVSSPSSPASELVVLVKPQFEAGRREAARGEGVIRDPEIHRRVLQEILCFAEDHQFGLVNLAQSPLLGPKGNVEFLAYFVYPGEENPDLDERIDLVI